MVAHVFGVFRKIVRMYRRIDSFNVAEIESHDSEPKNRFAYHHGRKHEESNHDEGQEPEADKLNATHDDEKSQHQK